MFFCFLFNFCFCFKSDPNCTNPSPIYKRLCKQKNFQISETVETSNDSNGIGNKNGELYTVVVILFFFLI